MSLTDKLPTSSQNHNSILIVDDAELIRDLLSINLKKFGYETTTAANGRDALQLINISDFDMVLLDVVMPEMSGLEVLKKNSPAIRNARVASHYGYGN